MGGRGFVVDGAGGSVVLPEVISWADAKAAGLTRYFLGQACPKGHVCERMVSNRDCVDCMRARSRADYETKGDEIRAKRRAYMRQAYRADPAKFRARSRAYYAADPAAWKQQVRDYEKRFPIHARWRHHIKKRRHAPGIFTADHLIACFDAQHGRCLCGADLCIDWTITKFRFAPAAYAQVAEQMRQERAQEAKPEPPGGQPQRVAEVSRGGTNWPDNIHLLCAFCNNSKHSKTMDEWSPK
jgi:HNH endonuclease